MNVLVDKTIDAKGLACPMPIVKTKKSMEGILPGQVLEIQATDKGSVADIQGWAKNTGHQYLGTVEEVGVFRHYLRKADPNEVKEETKYPYTITNEELQEKNEDGQDLVILDVREPAEYAFGHVPGAISIPLGELESRSNELNLDDEIFVICRTGNRSDVACQLLHEKGFTKLKNVLPGMTQWKGPIEKIQ
jgi:rhodanese-related sulfurtransferase/TusA-related sulfurtransferase